jgi:hypothetical protein
MNTNNKGSFVDPLISLNLSASISAETLLNIAVLKYCTYFEEWRLLESYAVWLL